MVFKLSHEIHDVKPPTANDIDTKPGKSMLFSGSLFVNKTSL